MFLQLFLDWSRDHPVLLSFPTRRSSDLTPVFAVGWAAVPMIFAVKLIAIYSIKTRQIFSHFRTRKCLTVLLKFRLKDRKSTRLNSSHVRSSYAVFCLKKKKNETDPVHTF